MAMHSNTHELLASMHNHFMDNKNIITIHDIGYVPLEFEKIRIMPLHHVFRQKSLLGPTTRGT
uniref:Uncharacterized protein n=1 Tax=Oryza rufipogon TaxID=4529 RepID=A0A0E0R8B3_ORYRU